MGMAYVAVLEKPRVRKVYGEWRVYYSTPWNEVWYRTFWSWDRAIAWALNVHAK